MLSTTNCIIFQPEHPMSKKPAASKSKSKSKPSPKKPAKKASTAAGPGASDAPPIASQIALPSGAAVKRLLNTQNDYATELGEVTGSLRQEIAEAVKNDHINKGALAMMKPLDKLARQKRGGGLEKLAVRMAHFFHYYEASGLKAKVDSVMSLDLRTEESQPEAPAAQEATEDGPPTSILPAESDVSQPRFTH